MNDTCYTRETPHSGPDNGVTWTQFNRAASENALTRPIFELGTCSLHTNIVEFDQDCNGNQLRGLCRQFYTKCRHFYVTISYR